MNMSAAKNTAACWGQVAALAEAPLSDHAQGVLIDLCTETIRAAATQSRGTPMTMADHLQQRGAQARRDQETIANIIDQASPESLARQLQLVSGDLRVALASDEASEIVGSRYGAVRYADLVRACTVMAVALALAEGITPTRDALALATRTLAAALEDLYPGKTIELRIPPFAAVQLATLDAEGSTHRRGTPPNVVEMSPEPFVRLATGAINWQEATRAYPISVSGAHADDVARMLPLFLTR